jgi:uncharacterized protein YndB with AHSA1/START domain
MNDTDTQDRTEVTYTRVFDAPRELIWECMTDPKHLTHFWGPVGVSTPLENITLDLRIGGVFETVMVNDSDGAEYRSKGVYTVIDPPETLAWTEPDNGTSATTTFVDLGDGRTEVRIHQTNIPAMFTTEEAQAGFKSSLDRFAAHLATLTSA